MGAIRQLLSGFLGGELDPMMGGRVETDNYQYGLATCENFVALAIGPLVKRPGFEYIRDAAATASWLGAFRFSIAQEYVIEWSELKARFFTNGGRVETAPNVAYELTTPYTAAEAPALWTQQSYDRLYVDHPAHPPAAIARTSAVTFSHAASVLLNGPFADENTDTTVTVTASATTGSITLTASSAIFLAGHVGALFRIQAKDFSDIKAWEAGMKAVAINDVVRSDGKAYKALTAGVTGSIQPTHTEGAEWDGQNKQDELNSKGPYGVQWQYLYDKFGIARITAFTDTTHVTATVLRQLPDSLTSVASFRWAHAAWSAAAGWPSIVVHGFGRQMHFMGFRFDGSVSGDYGGGRVNFATFTDSGRTAIDLAFSKVLATDDPPLWAAADARALLVGTASKEIAIGAINSQAALGEGNVKAEPQSFYGSEAVRPVQVGVQTIFAELGGTRIRTAGYDFARDRYAADDLTAAARHVTLPGVVQLAYGRTPYALVYVVRGDGQVAVHADTKLEVKGFSRFALGGGARALSAVCVFGEDRRHSELWLLVERTRLDGVKREIWRQTQWRELGDDRAECFFVDGGARVEASGGNGHFTGLTHLAGHTVAVLAGGAVVPGLSVNSGGELTLPAQAVPAEDYVAVIGLAYTATAVTLPPEVKSQRGTVQGMRHRLVKAMLRVLETLEIFVGGNQADDPLEECIDRSADDLMDAPIPLFSGDTQGDVDTTFDRNGAARFVSDQPLPAVITAAMLNYEMDLEDA